MEYHIEQVLYRDQRTTKTRYFRDRFGHRQQDACPTCKSNRLQVLSSPKSSRGFLTHNCNQATFSATAAASVSSSFSSSSSSMDDAFSIRGVSNSSCYRNCHNQYFLKFKRLFYQTDVQCGCEAVRFPTDSARKTIRSNSWFKKFPNALLLSAYLSLITFPYVCAVPTTISSRSSNSGHKSSPHNEMNLTALTAARYSAETAKVIAVDLKNKYRFDESGSNRENLFNSTPAYNWLPQIPKNSSADFDSHLESLELPQIIPELLSHIQTIRIPINVLVNDSSADDPDWSRNISNMRGSLENVIMDLEDGIADNKWQLKPAVSEDVMPESLKNLDQTNRRLRNWLIIRTLVEVLEYTLAVFNHFKISS